MKEKVKRPNLVIFNPDSWRGEAAGYAGNRIIRTPHLDALAAEGTGFTRAFAQNPVCVPSRCSFMTGWYPHVRGHRSMHHMLAPDEPELLKELKDAGYHVWWGGKNDMVRLEDEANHCSTRFHPPEDQRGEYYGKVRKPGSKHFYTHYEGKLPPEYAYFRDDGNAEGAVAFLENAPPEPFCLVLTLSLPHCPFAVEEPYYSMYDRFAMDIAPRLEEDKRPLTEKLIRERMGLAAYTESDFRELLAVYYGMITKSDFLLGNVISALKKNGHWDDTAVFFFSDHGEYGGDYGMVEKTENTLPDCLMRVPLVARIPGITPTRPISALVELVDFYATVKDLTGIPDRHTHFGKSLLPMMRGETTEHRDAVFAEGGSLPRERDYAYNTVKDREHPYFARCSLEAERRETHSKAVMIRTPEHKYIWRLGETHEFYDLEKDPRETRNRIADPAYETIRQKLRERLLTWFVETGDTVPHLMDLRGTFETLPREFARKPS